ncbi:MAG: four helix bundle protein [Nitrospira sp.]|nr:four helix bundle protein [Nitrospira sp.]MBH0182498.1 four helix bundle protein [Nitrospira sp.]MBH0185392.1 four helix bundle protein [Nitrospira sp.]
MVTHKDLAVWKKAMELATQVYSLTSQFPKEEMYGLTSQMRRSAVSIPSNIAEGAARHSRKEFIQFLHVASGSVAELETQLLLASRIGYLPTDIILTHTEEVRKMLLGLLRSLKQKPITHHSSPVTPSL